MTTHTEATALFIRNAGWQDAHRTLVAGDASNRRYERLTAANGDTVILMDAPADKGEDVRPFIRIAEFLLSLGLSAPRIYARDTGAGFLLIEDLGDDLFKTVIARTPEIEPTLYAATVDVLGVLHAAPAPPVKTYDSVLMTEYAALSYHWYLYALTGERETKAQSTFEDLFADLLRPLDAAPRVLIQRDYHAENLLWLPDRDGVARVGLLDFQDAMLGHRAYDLMSVLQDARRDVPREIEAAMIDRYLAQNPSAAEGFRAAYAILGVQRNLRIVGAFARLCLAMGKPRYIDLLPRVWEFVERNLAHPALAPVADHIRTTLPAPTPERMDHIRAQART
ncbi:phosphotransferase [Sulfitobacter sp. HNIBRBA3233]|uniref:aminoglycoside phosphotransferase family protein n=1 Tax=Sulfitobacter marinivivus TaxID=3158558 RepID=UPI0032DE5DC1